MEERITRATNIFNIGKGTTRNYRIRNVVEV